MKTKTLYCNRKWLNKRKDRTAFIMCAVDKDIWENDGKKCVTLSGEVKIADCGKIINLDLYCNDKKDKVNSLVKLDTLISELEIVRYIIEKEEVGDVS